MKTNMNSLDLISRNRYNLWEKVTQVFCFYMLTIFPLSYGKQGYVNITETKFKWFWISSVVFAGICLAILIYYAFFKNGALKTRQKDRKFNLTIPQIFVIAFTVWNVISALKSPYGKQTWMGVGRFEALASCLIYSGLFLLISMWGEFSDFFIKGPTVSVLIFAVVAVLQFFFEGVIYPKGYTFWTVRFMSTMGNVDMVGGYTATFLPLVFCSYVFTDDKKWNRIQLIDVFLLIYVFLIANVDSGKVGVLAGLLIAIPFLFDTQKHITKSCTALGVATLSLAVRRILGLTETGFHLSFDKRTLLYLLATVVLAALVYVFSKEKIKVKADAAKMRKYTLIVLAVLVVLALVVVYNYKGGNVLLSEMSELLHGRMSDTAGSSRGYIWKTSLKLAMARPTFGYGPGMFGAVYDAYDIFETYTDFAHNDFIQIAVCSGFGAVAIYLAFIISLAVKALKKAPVCPLLVIFGAACASYLVHSFFSFSIAIITPMFWVCAGILDKLSEQVKVS